ncbi:MAG: M3 family oligoendopeptidase [Anaerolineae bacterium]|nr:M3 family oligoendopeptidase [Anaerolineae bacterium]
MTVTTRQLPHWDMTPFFPSLEAPAYQAAFQGVIQGIADLVQDFESHGIDKREATPVDAALVGQFETIMDRLGALTESVRTVFSYTQSFIATNSRDNLAQAKLSELQQHAVKLAQLNTRFTAWLGSLDVEALIQQSAVAADHAFLLRKAKEEAGHLMSPAEESLAAELGVSSGTAWAKLHGNVTSQLSVPLEAEGETRKLPMSLIRALATDRDRETRRRAYEAELAAWPTVAVPLAAALNSIKGEVITLARRRRWPSPLDEALFDNNVDRPTLDAMMGAARDAFPHFRRYLRAKARLLGASQLPWYDLFAPVGVSQQVWEYSDATQFIAEQFGTYSPRLRDFARQAFAENWVDAEPRDGKRDGAFCMGVTPGVSRIFMNYKPAFNSVSTLAHELGHAYHNLNLAQRPPLQRSSPMVLAETASTFCETIVFQAVLSQASPQESLALLDSSLQDATQVVVDITSRFLFEQGVFERRAQRELSIEEFNALMLDTQRQTYGDGLDPNVLHPYMWAVKGHYYSSARSFYNYPYMFGLLFGLGLYALYQQDADAFRASYDELLASTGMADAATLAQRFGIDIRSQAFWQGSLDIVRHDIDRFEALVNESGN